MSPPSFIAFLTVLISFVHQIESSTSSDTSSDVPKHCPARCDMLKELDVIRGEMQTLRLMLNQESILRINLDQAIQSQSKKMENLDSILDMINISFSDQAETLSKRTKAIEEGIYVVNQTLLTKSTENDKRSIDLANKVEDNYIISQKAVKVLNESIEYVSNALLHNASEGRNKLTQSVVALSANLSIVKTALGKKLRNVNNELQNERSHRIKAEINFGKTLQEIRQDVVTFNQSKSNQGPKVAFSAIEAKRSSGKIIFEKVLLNQAKGYSNFTGIFTAPSTGIYMFYWTVATDEEKNCDTYLLVNNITTASNLVESGATKEDNSGSQSIIIELNRNDRVFIKQYSCNHIHSSWSSFSGFRYS